MIISAINIKGGPGKSTSCLALAAAYAEMGQRCLLLDLDPPQFTMAKYWRSIPKAKYEQPDIAGLQELLQSDKYDHILVDCPPRILREQPAPIVALLHSDIALVPVDSARDALDGCYGVDSFINRSIIERNQRLRLAVLITKYRSGSESCRSVRRDAMEDFREQVLKTVIPQRNDFNDAAEVGKNILAFAPESAGAKAYRKVAKELLDLWQAQQ